MMPAMARVTVYRDFDSLPASCMALFHSANVGVFLSLPWFRVLAATALERSELRIHALESDTGDVVHALLPMYGQDSGGRLFPVRRLTAAANFYTPIFSPLVGEQVSASECLNLLAREIASGAAGWDTVAVYPMDPDAPLYASVLSAFRAVGMAVQLYRCFGNWYLKVNGRSYNEYAAALPPRLRNTLKRKGQQLGQRLRIDLVTDGNDLDQAIAAYEAVYRASWKPPEAHPQFMPQLIRTGAEEGWLRLGIAWVDGQPAAAQVWTVAGGVASIYKLAYDQKFVRHSVGSLLTAALMRHVIDNDGVQEVDFLSGDDAYKQDWMSHRRERWGMAAFNLRTLPGILLAAVHFGRSAAKQALKHVMPGQGSRTASA